MKKLFALVVFIGLVSGYAFFVRENSIPTVSASSGNDTVQTASVADTAQTNTTASAQQQSAPTSQTNTTVATTPADKPKGQFTDGTYTGSSENAFYGMVQVRATVSGGKLTDVTFLTYPNDRSTSRMINDQAMPILSQEAIAAQSAQVDGVSGATDTSNAFVQSLSTALSSAKA